MLNSVLNTNTCISYHYLKTVQYFFELNGYKQNSLNNKNNSIFQNYKFTRNNLSN